MATRRAPRATVIGVGVVVVAVLVAVYLARPHAPGAAPLDLAGRQAAALTQALGRTPGSRAVDVGAGRDLRGNSYVATVVTLDPSATAADVSRTVAEMPGATRRADLPSTTSYRQLTFLTTRGARLTIGWESAVDQAAVGRAAGGWLAVSAALTGEGAGSATDVAAILLTGGDIDYHLGLGPGQAGGEEVLGVYDRAAAAVTADTPVEWELSATDGPTALTLSSQGAIDDARRQQWTALLADAGRIGGTLSVSRLDVSFADRVEAHLTFLTPDAVGDGDVTPAVYGDRVWPVVHPQLTTLAAATDHWSYFLSWAHQSEPGSEQLIALLFGDQGTVRDDTSKDRSPFASAGWAQAAQVYLAHHDLPRRAR